MQFVLGASALVFVVAAHNTNIETKFWSNFLTSHGRWNGTAAPTTGDMRFAQSQILLKVSGIRWDRFPVLNLTRSNVPRPTEIPDAVKGANGDAH